MKKGITIGSLVRSERGDTVEKNVNVMAWVGATIVLFAIIGGVAWYLIGTGANNVSSGTKTVYTSLSSQSGMNSLASNAMGGNTQSYTNSDGSTFTAPGSGATQ
ncbi:hypothetical protein [Sulfoacidibacillus ferrooxidans]|nr:hypothetical protein [Sulfoacidibacillus ferrooxidans]